MPTGFGFLRFLNRRNHKRITIHGSFLLTSIQIIWIRCKRTNKLRMLASGKGVWLNEEFILSSANGELRSLISKLCWSMQVFTFGSVPLKREVYS
ncbi:hypothetical protein HanRHA438_Chr03g0102671 [Helianthus annuus]|nr:hypothetical protein HanRHA438_Chr03g0102671 [Helianthus annuus]